MILFSGIIVDTVNISCSQSHRRKKIDTMLANIAILIGSLSELCTKMWHERTLQALCTSQTVQLISKYQNSLSHDSQPKIEGRENIKLKNKNHDRSIQEFSNSTHLVHIEVTLPMSIFILQILEKWFETCNSKSTAQTGNENAIVTTFNYHWTSTYILLLLSVTATTLTWFVSEEAPNKLVHASSSNFEIQCVSFGGQARHWPPILFLTQVHPFASASPQGGQVHIIEDWPSYHRALKTTAM